MFQKSLTWTALLRKQLLSPGGLVRPLTLSWGDTAVTGILIFFLCDLLKVWHRSLSSPPFRVGENRGEGGSLKWEYKDLESSLSCKLSGDGFDFTVEYSFEVSSRETEWDGRPELEM